MWMGSSLDMAIYLSGKFGWVGMIGTGQWVNSCLAQAKAPPSAVGMPVHLALWTTPVLMAGHAFAISGPAFSASLIAPPMMPPPVTSASCEVSIVASCVWMIWSCMVGVLSPRPGLQRACRVRGDVKLRDWIFSIQNMCLLQDPDCQSHTSRGVVEHRVGERASDGRGQHVVMAVANNAMARANRSGAARRRSKRSMC